MASGLNEIVDSGIPVVQFNLLVTSVKAPYVGERSVESGRILGAKVVEKLGGETATGKVIIGNCFPGFPVLENRAKGVQESLAAASGLEILGPFDVKVAANENYAAWEALLSANPDAKALVGLCAPDIASLGKLQAANASTPFVSGGYDLTAENLAEIKNGNAYVSLGQTPFMQGYLPVKMLADAIRGDVKNIDLSEGGFLDAGHGDRDRRQRRGAVQAPGPDVRRTRGTGSRPGQGTGLLPAARRQPDHVLVDAPRADRERVQVASP